MPIVLGTTMPVCRWLLRDAGDAAIGRCGRRIFHFAPLIRRAPTSGTDGAADSGAASVDVQLEREQPRSHAFGDVDGNVFCVTASAFTVM